MNLIAKTQCIVTLLSNAWEVSEILFVLIKKKIMNFLKTSLIHQTIARRTEEMGKTVKRSLERKAANFEFCALVIDESTDATDVAQLVTFTGDTANKYSITEEMAFRCH